MWRTTQRLLARSFTSMRGIPSDAWPAVITELKPMSPTVRYLGLRVTEREEAFRFVPGQWVDFFVKGLDQCGGFSFVSPPEAAPALGLAVKRSDVSPHAHWVHHHAQVGDMVHIKVGGTFFFEMTQAHLHRGTYLVFVAGGVGINPLVSMIRHIDEWLSRHPPDTRQQTAFRVSVLYSAATEDELIFREDLEAVCTRHPSIFTLELTCTRETEAWKGRRERMTGAHVLSRIPPEAQERAMVYVCGPSQMIDEVDETLRVGGLQPEQVMTEKWW